MTHDYDALDSGIAVLTSDIEDSTTVHGVAIGENDETQGMSGKTTRWPADALKEAADKLSGVPIVKEHPGTEKTESGLQVDAQPPLESKVGTVTSSKYKDGVGILWQGEINDPEIAEKVEQGLAEVSPVVARDIHPVEGEDDVFEAAQIKGFRDLGLVSRGAAPSNYITTGVAAMSADALAQAFDEPAESGATPGDDDPEGASTGTNSDSDTMTDKDDDLTEEQRELLAKADTLESPAVVESGVAALGAQAEEFETDDDSVHMMAESEHDALSETVSKVRGVMEEALQERTDLKESTIEALSFEALCEEFETEEGDLDAEALVQTPETGSAGDDDEESDPFEALADEDLAEARAAKERYEHWQGKNDTIADAEKQNIVEALGVESFDDVDMEAL